MDSIFLGGGLSMIQEVSRNTQPLLILRSMNVEVEQHTYKDYK